MKNSAQAAAGPGWLSETTQIFLTKGGEGLTQCPAGTQTQPATRYFFQYPTRPDSVLGSG